MRLERLIGQNSSILTEPLPFKPEDIKQTGAAIECRLDKGEEQRLFHPVDSLAVNPANNLAMASGKSGIYRSQDKGKHYQSISKKEFHEVVLPPTWLFVSGEHDITVEYE